MTIADVDVSDALQQVAEEGFAVLPDVLSPDQAALGRERLQATAEAQQERGVSTFIPVLDPNANNVRVVNLVDADPYFVDLLEHPVATGLAAGVLGEDWIVGNFTANIARPGSGSMSLHSDQYLVAPEPWLSPWAVNVIWCLTDCHRDNGATLYAPGSHRYETLAEVPKDLASQLVPFEAPAGSAILMEGRLWHTSGANITQDEERALAFAYLTKPFVRPQFNWSVGLRPEVQKSMSPTMRYRLGLDAVLSKLPDALRLKPSEDGMP